MCLSIVDLFLFIVICFFIWQGLVLLRIQSKFTDKIKIDSILSTDLDATYRPTPKVPKISLESFCEQDNNAVQQALSSTQEFISDHLNRDKVVSDKYSDEELLTMTLNRHNENPIFEDVSDLEMQNLIHQEYNIDSDSRNDFNLRIARKNKQAGKNAYRNTRVKALDAWYDLEQDYDEDNEPWWCQYGEDEI